MLEFSLTSVARRFLVFFALLSGIQGDCGAPPKLINAIPKVDIHGKSFPPGTTVIYKCLDNFYNIHAKSDVVTCLAESKWTNIEEFCERSCLDPPRVQFANMREEDKQSYYTAGTTVTYICRNTHSIIPGIDSVITCLDNYTWTAVPVFCKGKSCGDPGSPPNGKAIILTDLLYLARVNFTCDDGYTLIGSPSTRCLRKGDGVKWQNKPPVCERIIASTTTATFSSGQTKTDVISIGPTVKLSGDATTHIPATTALITPTAFASGQTEKDDKSLGAFQRQSRFHLLPLAVQQQKKQMGTEAFSPFVACYPRWRSKPVCPSPKRRCRHTCLLCASGTGKLQPRVGEIASTGWRRISHWRGRW